MRGKAPRMLRRLLDPRVVSTTTILAIGCSPLSAETGDAIDGIVFEQGACPTQDCTPIDVDDRTVVDLPEGDTTVTLDGETAYRLPGGCAVLDLRRVHPVMSLASVQDAEGMPYVSVDGSWAEVVESVTVAQGGFRYQIENLGCDTEEVVDDDFIYPAIASCTVSVRTDCGEPSLVTPGDLGGVLRFDTRYEGLAGTRNGQDFLQVRELGFVLGNIDREADPPTPTVLRMGVDFVTPFGVYNLDYDLFDEAAIGHRQEIQVGPHTLDVEILDVGNVNTHCHTGQCINVFEIEVSDAFDATPTRPSILSYR